MYQMCSCACFYLFLRAWYDWLNECLEYGTKDQASIKLCCKMNWTALVSLCCLAMMPRVVTCKLSCVCTTSALIIKLLHQVQFSYTIYSSVMSVLLKAKLCEFPLNIVRVYTCLCACVCGCEGCFLLKLMMRYVPAKLKFSHAQSVCVCVCVRRWRSVNQEVISRPSKKMKVISITHM